MPAGSTGHGAGSPCRASNSGSPRHTGAAGLATTRAVSATPVARMRASDDVRTIGFDDLRFDVNEALLLLERLGVSLDVAEVRTLVHRTEGWAAGIQLAGMAVRDARDPVAALAQFGGTTPDVADYFASEVLEGLPDDTRRFLRDTSISEVLIPQLCGFLTERGDVASLLGTLARS